MMKEADGRKACDGVVATQDSRGSRKRGSDVDCILICLNCVEFRKCRSASCCVFVVVGMISMRRSAEPKA